MANEQTWEWHRGKKHSPEWVEAQAAGVAKAWKDPSKFKTMRKQSRELVAKRFAKWGGSPEAHARAVLHTPEVAKKISQSLIGRKLSDEHKARSASGLFRYEQLTLEQKAKRNSAIAKQRIGCHNYGRAARDRLDHFNAKHWVIRSPEGITYEFDNLQSWCRANESLFLPDDHPGAKLPLWHRAVSGFNGMIRRDAKAQHAWKGWTLVSSIERHAQGAPDLLKR